MEDSLISSGRFRKIIDEIIKRNKCKCLVNKYGLGL